MTPATHDYRTFLAARRARVSPPTPKRPGDLVLVGSGARARVHTVESK